MVDQVLQGGELALADGVDAVLVVDPEVLVATDGG